MPFFGQGIEWAIRPFQLREAILQRMIDRRPPAAEGGTANIRWGAQSTFGFKEGDWALGPEVTVIYPDPDPPENPEEFPEAVTLDFQEESREETEERRVENPDDPDQYVMVKDVTVIVFSGPDLRPPDMVGREGRQSKLYYRYTFTPPEE